MAEAGPHAANIPVPPPFPQALQQPAQPTQQAQETVHLIWSH